MTTSSRRAVAPVEGVKGGLRSLRSERERRHGVQGRPRLERFIHAIDWDYVRLWLAVFASVFVVVFVALERGA